MYGLRESRDYLQEQLLYVMNGKKSLYQLMQHSKQLKYCYGKIGKVFRVADNLVKEYGGNSNDGQKGWKD